MDIFGNFFYFINYINITNLIALKNIIVIPRRKIKKFEYLENNQSKKRLETLYHACLFSYNLVKFSELQINLDEPEKSTGPSERRAFLPLFCTYYERNYNRTQVPVNYLISLKYNILFKQMFLASLELLTILVGKEKEKKNKKNCTQ